MMPQSKVWYKYRSVSVPIPFSVQFVPSNMWQGAEAIVEASRTNPFIVGGSFNVGAVNALFFFFLNVLRCCRQVLQCMSESISACSAPDE